MHARENGAEETLVRFEPPVERAGGGEREGEACARLKETLLSSAGRAGVPELDAFLNIIVAPREWGDDGRHFVQYVSHQPATREDVVALQKRLDERLGARHAKARGICPIREELHAQCFDELIRQVAVDCPERGLLLMRVRDELKMTLAAYITLYKSAVAFGLRKQLEAQTGVPELEARVAALRAQGAELAQRKAELLARKAAVEQRVAEQRASEQREQRQELEFLEHQNSSLRLFLQSLDSAGRPAAA